jgi:hypothetical protein
MEKNVTNVDFTTIFYSGTSFTYVDDPAYLVITKNVSCTTFYLSEFFFVIFNIHKLSMYIGICTKIHECFEYKMKLLFSTYDARQTNIGANIYPIN